MQPECLLNWGLGVGCQADSPQGPSNVVSSSGLHRSRGNGFSPIALSRDHGENGFRESRTGDMILSKVPTLTSIPQYLFLS